MYRFKPAADSKSTLRAQLFGSGAILNEVVAAQEILAKYGVAADVWSVTSYQELYREAHACERWNMLHPTEKPRVPYVTQCLADAPGVLVAASDYVKVLPDSIDRWMPRRIRSLGTDGFGRSEDRQALRDFFEVDAKFVVVATLAELLKEGQIDAKVVQKAIKDLGVNADKKDPAKA
jgi:pyruvate dehydrogenase E1 component